MSSGAAGVTHGRGLPRACAHTHPAVRVELTRGPGPRLHPPPPEGPPGLCPDTWRVASSCCIEARWNLVLAGGLSGAGWQGCGGALAPPGGAGSPKAVLAGMGILRLLGRRDGPPGAHHRAVTGGETWPCVPGPCHFIRYGRGPWEGFGSGCASPGGLGPPGDHGAGERVTAFGVNFLMYERGRHSSPGITCRSSGLNLG